MKSSAVPLGGTAFYYTPFADFSQQKTGREMAVYVNFMRFDSHGKSRTEFLDRLSLKGIIFVSNT